MAEGEAAAKNGDRYTVQSLVRALNVLEALGADRDAEGMSVTDVAERVGVSKSATFAILHTLLGAGFVADSGTGQNRRYYLGMALARLGAQAATSRSFGDIARPILRELAEDLGLSVRLGTVNRDTIEILERVDSPDGIRIDLRMGERELLHTTAIGKAIMARWSDADVLSALGPGPLPERTEQTLTDPQDVLANIASIRRRGYAVDDEEDFAGILCIGAAVPLDAEHGAWGISTTTLKALASTGKVKAIGLKLRAGAAEIAAAIAGTGQTPSATVRKADR